MFEIANQLLENDTLLLEDMEFLFECSTHEFTALTRRTPSLTLEEKFHISDRPRIILYVSFPQFVYDLFNKGLSMTISVNTYPLPAIFQTSTLGFWI